MRKLPRILFFDLETGGVNAFKSDLGMILNFGYKFLGDKQARVLTVDQYPNWFSPKTGVNDFGILKAALDIMEEADLLVTHYGDVFDSRFVKGRCVIHGLTPPPPTKMRDTWRIAKTQFNFSSNRLGNLSKVLHLKVKKHEKSANEWPGWWIRAMAGDVESIHEMGEYCRQDVETLESLYLRLVPFDTAHPRVQTDRTKCGYCAGKVQYRGHCWYIGNKYRRFQCTACGRWGRDVKKMAE